MCWEVFNWRTGKVLYRTESESDARSEAYTYGNDYDYAREGEGY